MGSESLGLEARSTRGPALSEAMAGTGGDAFVLVFAGLTSTHAVRVKVAKLR